jgi:hypothetical protein
MVFDEEFAITGALDMVFKTGEDTYAIYGKFSSSASWVLLTSPRLFTHRLETLERHQDERRREVQLASRAPARQQLYEVLAAA